MRSKIVLAAFLTACGAMSGTVRAQTTSSIWDGAYTDAQAERGKNQYLAHCSMCHGASLGGNGEAPPLTGEIMPDWEGTTLDQLFDKINTTMPLNAPGTLGAGASADILAFILKSNNIPAGTKDLVAGDALKMISFDTNKPPPAPAPAAKPTKSKAR